MLMEQLLHSWLFLVYPSRVVPVEAPATSRMLGSVAEEFPDVAGALIFLRPLKFLSI